MKKNLFKRIIAIVAAAVLAAGIMAPAGALADDVQDTPTPINVIAEKVKVAELVNFKVTKNVTVKKTLTDEAAKTTVNLTTSYPYVKVTGDTALAKVIRKTVKKVAYTNVYKQILKDLKAGNVYPSDAVVNIELTYNDEASTRCGNIGSFVFTKTAYVEGGAYPTNETFVVNVDLSTGKKLTLTSMFKSYKKVRSFLAKSAKSYADDQYKQVEPMFAVNEELKDEFGFFENLKLDDVKAAIDINSVKFNWDGVTIYFDETDGLWPHAFGTQEMFIPYDDITPYIKSTQGQLFRPYSVEVIKLEYNAGTGYSWVGGCESDKDTCLELVYENSYAKNLSPMLAGGRMVDVLVYKAVKEGTAKIDCKLVRPWETSGEPADTYTRNLIVTSDLFITDVNGE